MERNCLYCKKIFRPASSNVCQGKGLACSRSCNMNYKWSQPEYRHQMSLRHVGRPSGKKGKSVAPEIREAISNSLKGHTPWNKGKKCPQFSGINNYRWIIDRSKLSKGREIEYRNNPAHHNWSLNVKNRDGWKCQISNSDCSGRMEAHHILSWKNYPELRYQLNNGITLCHFHHPRKRSEEKRLSPYFQSLVMAKMQ